MWWIVGIVAVLLVFIVILAVYRAKSGFGMGDMVEVGRNLSVIQKNAFRAAGCAPPGEGGGGAVIAKQAFATSRGLSVAYTVEREGETFRHHLSCQAPGRSRKFLTQATLFAMMLVGKQLEDSGLGGDDGPGFEIAESETGTQHVGFALSAEQQERMTGAVFAD
jgi:hypothetical protein